MSLHHFPHQAINGAWHCVYRIQGCGSLHSIGEAFCKAGAQRMADQANREQRAKQDACRECANGMHEHSSLHAAASMKRWVTV